MPKGKGIYTRKGANGRKMYFRNGKMISEKSYRASLARRRSAKKPNPGRSPTRRNKPMARRYRKPAMPHPSITGMAAGLTVASYLNTGGPNVTSTSDVIKQALGGKLSGSFNMLAKNSISLVTSDNGKKALSSAIVLATAGGLARKWFPNVKMGTQKHYFKI